MEDSGGMTVTKTVHQMHTNDNSCLWLSCLLCARHCAVPFLSMIALSPHSSSEKQMFVSPFTDKEAE